MCCECRISDNIIVLGALIINDKYINLEACTGTMCEKECKYQSSDYGTELYILSNHAKKEWNKLGKSKRYKHTGKTINHVWG